MLFDQYARALPGWRDYVGYSYDPSGRQVRARSATASARARVSSTPVYGIDPNMTHPRVDEWTAGIERELTKDVRLAVTGIWREDKNIQASVYPDARWDPTTVTNGLTDQPLTVYNWANRAASESTPDPDERGRLRLPRLERQRARHARAERKYQGVMVVLDKRFTNRWQGRISYVWSKNGSSINNTGSNSYGQTSAFETPTYALVNNYGRPVNDRTHEVKVYGTWQVPKIEVGLNAYFNYLSGRTYTPYQRYSSRQIVYPRSAGRQPWLEPFGDRRLDNETSLDVRLEKIFKLGNGTSRMLGLRRHPERLQRRHHHLGQHPLPQHLGRGRGRGLRQPDHDHRAATLAARSALELLTPSLGRVA